MTRSAAQLAPILLFALALAFAGCRTNPPRAQIVYDGPTSRIYDVIEDINKNNRAIKTLWARGEFELWIREKKTDPANYVNGDATLLYRKPQDLSFKGKKELVGPVFEVGSNGEKYWLLVPRMDTLWIGDWSIISSVDNAEIPIRPDLLLEVLGIGEIDSNLLRAPMPVMRFNNDHDAYMITWVEMRPDRLIATKEVWYDRKTKRPKLVSLFDENGRIVLRAYLSDYKLLETEGTPKDQWPVMASTYDLYFVESRTKMIFRLSELRSSYKGFPKDLSFRPPGAEAASKVIHIDEQPPAR